MIKQIRNLFIRGLKRDKFQVARREDGNFLLNYRNYIDRKILLDGAYERKQLDTLCSMAAQHGCEEFFDVGANIGLYSVKMSSIHTIKKVYAFEPVSENRNQLHANILLNNLDDVVDVYGIALSDASGNVPFLKNTGNSTGRSRIKDTNSHDLDTHAFAEVNVRTERLDDIFVRDGKKIAIKIDVEGHEIKTLRGMKSLLLNNSCVVQVESFESEISSCRSFFESLMYKHVESIADDHYFTNCTL